MNINEMATPLGGQTASAATARSCQRAAKWVSSESKVSAVSLCVVVVDEV